jgi:hypothetical protein
MSNTGYTRPKRQVFAHGRYRNSWH